MDRWRIIFLRSHLEELFVQAAKAGDLESVRNLKYELGDMVGTPFGKAICYEALQLAAQNGHATIVKELLGYGGDAIRFWTFSKPEDVRFGDDWPEWHFRGAQMTSSPLHLAVKEGHLEVVQELVGMLQRKKDSIDSHMKYKIWADTVQSWFQGLVEWAVRWGDAHILSVILRSDEPALPLVPLKGCLFLPVHLAAHHDHPDALKILLQHHDRKDTFPYPIDLPVFSTDGLTALHVAAQCGSTSAAALLLDIGTMDVNARSRQELFTPLHMAANSGHVAVVDLLLQSCRPNSAGAAGKKVDLMAKDRMGRTALHYAAREGHEKVAQQLMLACAAHGMLADNLAGAVDLDGLLALHMAARAGHTEVIKTLKLHGTLQAGGSSHSIMSKARHSANMRVMLERQYLFEKEFMFERNKWVEVSSKNIYYGEEVRYPRPQLIDFLFWKTEGFTPLHFAARYGHEAAVRELLRGASVGDLHVKDHDQGLMAYEWMELRGQGDAFLRCVEEEFEARGYIDVVEDLKKASSCEGKMTAREGRLKIAEDIREEEEAMKELELHALRKGGPQLIMPLVRWLEDENIGSIRVYWLQWAAACGDMELLNNLLAVFANLEKSPEGAGSSSIHYQAVKEALLKARNADTAIQLLSHILPAAGFNILEDAYQALEAAVKQDRFSAAKGILSQVPALVWTKGDRVAFLVKEFLASHQFNLSRLSNHLLSNKRSSDEVQDFLMDLVTKERLVGASNLLRLMLPWAKGWRPHLNRLVEVLADMPELKRGLYEDRQVYLDCANAILVGAALITGLAFQGWLQPPLGYNDVYEGLGYAEVHHQAVRVFWRFNTGAFFLAVGALIAGAKGAVPMTRETSIVESVEKVRRAVAVSSMLLGMALVCVMVAFTAAGFAVLPPLASDRHMMRDSVAWGSVVCGLALIWFFFSVLPLLYQTLLKVPLHICIHWRFCVCSVFWKAFDWLAHRVGSPCGTSRIS